MENEAQFMTKYLNLVNLATSQSFLNGGAILLKYYVKLIEAPPLKLKGLLNTKIDPVQTINRLVEYKTIKIFFKCKKDDDNTS